MSLQLFKIILEKPFVMLDYDGINMKMNNRDKLCQYSCVIYREICSCGADYIGETVRNARLRWNEHENSIDNNS